MFKLEVIQPDKNVIECKGLIFRYKQSSYIGNMGEICFSEKFVRLKRKSCRCERCCSMLEELHELVYNNYRSLSWPRDLKNGDLCYLEMTNISTDWETGYVDGYDLEFIRVVEYE